MFASPLIVPSAASAFAAVMALVAEGASPKAIAHAKAVWLHAVALDGPVVAVPKKGWV